MHWWESLCFFNTQLTADFESGLLSSVESVCFCFATHFCSHSIKRLLPIALSESLYFSTHCCSHFRQGVLRLCRYLWAADTLRSQLKDNLAATGLCLSLSMSLSACLSVCLSVCLYVCLSVCLSVCVCACVCACIWLSRKDLFQPVGVPGVQGVAVPYPLCAQDALRDGRRPLALITRQPV